MRYVALLRGINVGGKTLIKMADLRACVEQLGFDDVSTYIASGNVLFATDGDANRLAEPHHQHLFGLCDGEDGAVADDDDDQQNDEGGDTCNGGFHRVPPCCG